MASLRGSLADLVDSFLSRGLVLFLVGMEARGRLIPIKSQRATSSGSQAGVSLSGQLGGFRTVLGVVLGIAGFILFTV